MYMFYKIIKVMYPAWMPQVDLSLSVPAIHRSRKSPPAFAIGLVPSQLPLIQEQFYSIKDTVNS